MWDAVLYDKLSKERMQPSIDLTARIADKTCRRVIDVGCGTGLSTIPLKRQWPEAEIVGVDLSAEMLEKAKLTLDNVTWLQRDCSKPIDDLGAFDIVFSNAFLQWLRNQEEFLRNTCELLNEDGVLAIQLPDFKSMPASGCIDLVTKEYPEILKSVENTIYADNFKIEEYYDILKRYYADVEVWRTDYYHVMPDHAGILEFIKGTALRPYLARMDQDTAKSFQCKILEELKKHYTVREDGKVLFEFKRMFMIARRKK